MAGSASRNRTIITGIAGVILGLMVGVSVATLAVSADERDAAAAGPGRGAGLVNPSLFEGPLQRDAAAAGPGRGAGLVNPSLFEGPLQRDAAAAGPGRGAGLVNPSLFEGPLDGI